MPEQIKPWIDLITWPLLALFAGVALLPAVYIFVMRIKGGKIGDVEFDLSRRDVKMIEDAATEAAEEKTAQVAQQELTSLTKDEPEDLSDRMENVIGAWKNLQVLVKARATLVGGTEDLRAIVPNLRLLAQRYPDTLTPEHAKRAEKLRADMTAYKAEPTSLTKAAYKGFAVRAGHLASAISRIPIAGS
jgi:hypothetical protein